MHLTTPFDSSAALAVLSAALPFASVKLIAEDVRLNVRNEWAHCDFTIWMQGHYDVCFDLMEALVANLGFPSADETRILDELRLWRTQGTMKRTTKFVNSFSLSAP